MDKQVKPESIRVNLRMGFLGWVTLTMFILWANPGGHLDSPVQDWSLWLVFLPIYIFPALLLVGLIGIFVVGFVEFIVEEINIARKKRAKRKR